MKRIRLLVLAGVIAAALPIGMTTAGATGGSTPANYVEIKDRAQYRACGTNIEVGLTVKCKNNGNPLRTVECLRDAELPRDPLPQGATGLGARTWCVTAWRARWPSAFPPGCFDAGRAQGNGNPGPATGPTTRDGAEAGSPSSTCSPPTQHQAKAPGIGGLRVSAVAYPAVIPRM